MDMAAGTKRIGTPSTEKPASKAKAVTKAGPPTIGTPSQPRSHQQDFVVFVAELYRTATLHLAQEGGTQLCITADVIQCSPLSGSSFVMLMDTIREAFVQAVPLGAGLVRAYAGFPASGSESGRFIGELRFASGASDAETLHLLRCRSRRPLPLRCTELAHCQFCCTPS